jgi:hypothetical protein
MDNQSGTAQSSITWTFYVPAKKRGGKKKVGEAKTHKELDEERQRLRRSYGDNFTIEAKP